MYQSSQQNYKNALCKQFAIRSALSITVSIDCTMAPYVKESLGKKWTMGFSMRVSGQKMDAKMAKASKSRQTALSMKVTGA